MASFNDNKTLERWALQPKTGVSTTVAVLANTQSSFSIPEGAMEFTLRPRTLANTWHWSFLTGHVAGGGGTHMSAGEMLNIDGPLSAQSIYFTSGTTDTFDVAYLDRG